LRRPPQVYRATLLPLLGGGEVAVKVQRPGVLAAVVLDLHVMRELALYLQTFPEVGAQEGGLPACVEWG
jgi:predicted unusual protein kinase regulating ubiquinone biosynthesis (AarF/ABC1/UbiB family)